MTGKSTTASMQHLVETDWLEQHLGDNTLRIFDCGVTTLPNPDPVQATRQPLVFEAARTRYEEAHIPGAAFIDVPGQLSDTASGMPLTRPSAQRFAETMGRYGIDANTHVVLYSSTEPHWAARVWWMLRAYGFDQAGILNGGRARWLAEGRAVSSAPATYPATTFTARTRPGAFVDKHAVLAAIGDNATRTISALPAAIHSGESDVVFGRKGHIPGSRNIPFMSLHDPDTGKYLAPEQLRERFDSVQANEAERIITYCGGGIAASNNAFALSLLGYDNVHVYDGSMLEWGNDASLPMETA